MGLLSSLLGWLQTLKQLDSFRMIYTTDQQFLVVVQESTIMKNIILDHAPGPLREQQEATLKWIEDNWEKYDVFVVQAPTASGKSWIGKTIIDWNAARKVGTSLLTPTRILQDMYLEEFPELPNLKGMSNYETKGEYRHMRRRCQHSHGAVFNYHSFFSNKDSMKTDTLIVDEAHKLPSFLSDLSSLACWKHKYKYPNGMDCLGDVAMWLEKHIKFLRSKVSRSRKSDLRFKMGFQIKRMARILYDIEAAHNDFFMEYRKEPFRGRPSELLFVKPLSMRSLSPKLWTSRTKIILMSATINKGDIVDMGLGSRRIGYFECSSPIPAKSRPFVVMPTADMSYKKQAHSIPVMAAKLQELADSHPDKGIIHMPYGLVPKFRRFLKDRRFWYHTKENKQEVFDAFVAAEDNPILVASGMEEGIDLVGDLSRWQVITKVMYPSLADNYVKELLKRSQRQYNWTTARTVQQQAGRICRTPEDHGTTYMLDSGFVSFYGRTRDLWAGWFNEAMKWEI